MKYFTKLAKSKITATPTFASVVPNKTTNKFDVSVMMSVPAHQVGGTGRPRYYGYKQENITLAQGVAKLPSFQRKATNKATEARGDSIRYDVAQRIQNTSSFRNIHTFGLPAPAKRNKGG